jgi:hypothetical protein
MQFDKFRARRATRFARQSGISAKRLEDKSSDCSVFISGDRLDAVNIVRPLSARLRWRRKRHFDIGRIPVDESRFDELPLGVPSRPLDAELPDERRSFGVLLLDCPLE